MPIITRRANHPAVLITQVQTMSHRSDGEKANLTNKDITQNLKMSSMMNQAKKNLTRRKSHHADIGRLCSYTTAKEGKKTAERAAQRGGGGGGVDE